MDYLHECLNKLFLAAPELADIRNIRAWPRPCDKTCQPECHRRPSGQLLWGTNVSGFFTSKLQADHSCVNVINSGFGMTVWIASVDGAGHAILASHPLLGSLMNRPWCHLQVG